MIYIKSYSENINRKGITLIYNNNKPLTLCISGRIEILNIKAKEIQDFKTSQFFGPLKELRLDIDNFSNISDFRIHEFGHIENFFMNMRSYSAIPTYSFRPFYPQIMRLVILSELPKGDKIKLRKGLFIFVGQVIKFDNNILKLNNINDVYINHQIISRSLINYENKDKKVVRDAKAISLQEFLKKETNTFYLLSK